MKTRKTIIAIALSSLMISSPSFSEEFNFLKEINKDAESEKKSYTKEENKVKPNLTKNNRVSLEEKTGMKKVLSNVDYLIDPENSIKKANILSEKENELELYKIELKKAIVQEQLNEIKRNDLERNYNEAIELERLKWASEKESAEVLKDEEINSLKFELQLRDQISNSVKKLKEENIEDRLFATKVYGIGRNMVAKIYFDNKINSYSIGDEVIPGVKVLKIDINGVLISYNEELISLKLTTVEHATYKTFELSKIEDELKNSPVQQNIGPQAVPF